MTTDMEFGLLGPLVVRRDGITVAVPQGKQRALLAVLLLNVGRVVSLDDLAEALWGTAPPPSARVTIQNYVRRLRKALGDEGGARIVTHARGYSIVASAAELDLTRFAGCLAAGRAAARDGSWETALAEARTALSLWRGEPLADVESELLAERDVPRLDEMRLAATETRIDAELRLGYAAELVTELRQLAAVHPLREHLRAQLMLALYRDGRQAEALAVYADARRVLIGELGTEPGPELRDLQQRMLAADPELIAEAAGGARAADGGGGALAARRAPSPYRGLAAFGERDAGLFFGREAATARLLDRLSAALAGTGLVVVSGVSGAGKSSLLRAGVLPQLRHFGLAVAPEAASWPRLVLTPGDDPLAELAVRIAPPAGADAAAVHERLAADPAGFALTARQAALAAARAPAAGADGTGLSAADPLDAERRRVLIVVDQCEQLFTVCQSQPRRQAFVTALDAAVRMPRPAALAVLVVRADFEARLADYPELSPAVQDRYLLTAMTARQLRLAITRPAEAAGARVDEDLVRVLLDEVRAGNRGADTIRAGAGGAPSAGAHGGAGVLPLLSHALDQTWQAHAGEALALADYERTGGIEGAVAASAQRAYDGLAPAQQEAARQVFTRLTAADEDGADTAVRVARADLAAPAAIGGKGAAGTAGEDAARARDVDVVLETFAAQRLLTLDAGSVEITHETLLTAWPLLRDTWLADARADRVVRTRMHATAAEWDQAARDPSYLYRGGRLDAAAGTAARIAADARHAPLSRAETDFLRASRAAARRRAHARRGLIAALLALVTALTTVWIIAVRARQATATQRDIAAARLLISESKAFGNANATASDIESIAAWTLDPSRQARAALLADAASPQIATITAGTNVVDSLAYSPDGKILATSGASGGGDIVQLWDAATGQQLGPPLPADSVVGFSADGRTLVTDTDYAVQQWDVATGRQAAKPIPIVGGASGEAPTVSLIEDGATLAAVNGNNGDVQLWDLATGRRLGRIADFKGSLLALSPDGRTLATEDTSGSIMDPPMVQEVRLWDLTTGNKLRGGKVLPDSTTYETITSVAFSPDGKIVADIGGNDTVRLWNAATGKPIGRPLATGGQVNAIAFKPGGTTLATGDQDGTVQLWNVATGQQTGGPFTSGGQVNAIAFSPDGMTLATGNADGTARLWELAPATPKSVGTGSATDVGPDTWTAFGADGATLTVVTSSGAVRMWDLATGQQADKTFTVPLNDPYTVIGPPGGDRNDAAGEVIPGEPTREGISPDGPGVVWPYVLPPGLPDGAAQLWTTNPGPISSAIGGGSALLSPDGTVLVTVVDDDSSNVGDKIGDALVQLWDVATGKPAGPGMAVDGTVAWIAFTPDGKELATSESPSDSSANLVQLWDVADGQPIGKPLSFPGGAGPAWVALTPHGTTLTVSSPYGPVEQWDTSTGKQAGRPFAARFGPITWLALSPDGTTLAIGGLNGVAQLWNVITGQQTGTISGADGVDWGVFSPDGTVLATVAGYDSENGNGPVQLWDAATGQPIGGTLGGTDSDAVAFSPDGKTLAIVSDAGAVQLWDVSYLTDPLAKLCSDIGGSVTPAEWAQYVPPGPAYRNACP